ncbi:MAG: hypothetical protein U1F43_26230 [Myxococcota bacterium]
MIDLARKARSKDDVVVKPSSGPTKAQQIAEATRELRVTEAANEQSCLRVAHENTLAKIAEDRQQRSIPAEVADIRVKTEQVRYAKELAKIESDRGDRIADLVAEGELARETNEHKKAQLELDRELLTIQQQYIRGELDFKPRLKPARTQPEARQRPKSASFARRTSRTLRTREGTRRRRD